MEIAMAKARVVFDKLIQDSQDYGSTDEHMVSRVFFTLELEGKTHNDLYADIKQTVGSSFEIASLEVSPPRGYAGPFNHEAFRKAAEAYYRGLVGGSGSGIRIQGGGSARMRDNMFDKKSQLDFEVGNPPAAW
jgi:hypothetical protein